MKKSGNNHDLLWDAIDNDNLPELKIILENNIVEKQIKNEYGFSPLHNSINKEFVEISKILIHYGFDVDSQDSKGQTPLHYCGFYNDIETAKLLLAYGANINQIDIYGNGPLWTAVFNDKGFGRRIEIINIFVGAGANINHVNNAGRSPKSFADESSYDEVAKLLSS